MLFDGCPRFAVNIDAERAAVAIAIRQRAKRGDGRMAAEKIDDGLLQRGAVVRRAVASLAVDDEPDFSVPVAALMQGIIKAGNAVGHVIAVQVDNAGKGQFAALHGGEAFGGNAVEIEHHSIVPPRHGRRTHALRGKAALQGLGDRTLARTGEMGMFVFMSEGRDVADQFGK